MKIYQKMKAAVIDLTDVLDEAVAFDAYTKKVGKKVSVKAGERRFAYAHAANARRDAEEAALYSDDHFTRISIS